MINFFFTERKGQSKIQKQKVKVWSLTKKVWYEKKSVRRWRMKKLRGKLRRKKVHHISDFTLPVNLILEFRTFNRFLEYLGLKLETNWTSFKSKFKKHDNFWSICEKANALKTFLYFMSINYHIKTNESTSLNKTNIFKFCNIIYFKIVDHQSSFSYLKK
jgi:hypothetical protein